MRTARNGTACPRAIRRRKLANSLTDRKSQPAPPVGSQQRQSDASATRSRRPAIPPANHRCFDVLLHIISRHFVISTHKFPTHPSTLKRFGSDQFVRRDRSTRGICSLDVPVGPDYVLGPGDSLTIDFWGGVSQTLLALVGPMDI